MSLNQNCSPGRLQYHSAAAGGSTYGVWSLGNFWRSLSLRFCKNKQGHILPYTLLSFSSFIFLLLNSPQIWNQRWSASARLCHSRTDSSVTGTSQLTYHSNMNTSIYYYYFIITVSYAILFCLPGNTDSSSHMDVMFSADDSVNVKHLN